MSCSSNYIKELKYLAKEFGLDVKFEEINPLDIKFDLRVRWKCKFGCKSYGKKSCPPNVPDFEECVKFVRSYRNAILFTFRIKDLSDVKKAQEFMLKAERVVSKPYALSTFPGGCVLCNEEVCRVNCEKARPSLTALCIDSTQFKLSKDEMVAILFIE